jgi:hypothetical protein
VPNHKLSAKEAALLAQVRAELGKKPAAQADTAAPHPGTPQQSPGQSIAGAEGAAPVARARPAAPLARAGQAAPIASIEPVAPAGARPALILDPAERVAVLMAAARAETERKRKRQRQLYVWVPAAFVCIIGLWTLLWMWYKL